MTDLPPTPDAPVRGRRMNRLNAESIAVPLRINGEITDVEVYREDHFLVMTGDTETSYLVLDLAIEERVTPVVERDADGVPSFVVGDDGRPQLAWEPTGVIGLQVQPIDDETGKGLTQPTLRLLQPPRPGHYDTGWVGWTHVPDSPRRPARPQLEDLVVGTEFENQLPPPTEGEPG